MGADVAVGNQLVDFTAKSTTAELPTETFSSSADLALEKSNLFAAKSAMSPVEVALERSRSQHVVDEVQRTPIHLKQPIPVVRLQDTPNATTEPSSSLAAKVGSLVAKVGSLVAKVGEEILPKQVVKAGAIAVTALAAAFANAGQVLGLDEVTFYDNTSVATMPDEGFIMTFSSNSSSAGVLGMVGAGTPYFDVARTVDEMSFIFVMGQGDINDLNFLRIGNSNDPLSYDGQDHYATGLGNYGNLSWEVQRSLADINAVQIGEMEGTPIYRGTASGLGLDLDGSEIFNPIFTGRSLDGGVFPVMMVNDFMSIDDLGYYKLLSDNTQLISAFGVTSGDNALMYSASGTIGAVPESSSVMLLGIAITLMSLRRYRD